MDEIQSNKIYTTAETQNHLRISSSTIKRLLKKGIIRANKVGGQYRILGREILRLVSPVAERKAVSLYQEAKLKIKTKMQDW